jgi:hypothetical protein
LKGVLDRWVVMLRSRQGRHQLVHLAPVLRGQKVENTVRNELLFIPFKIGFVQLDQHRLALIVLAKIGFLQGNPSMDLVNLYGKLILDALHGQVLAQGFELVTNVPVVTALKPTGLQEF